MHLTIMLVALFAGHACAEPAGKIDSVFSPARIFTATVHRGADDVQLATGKPVELGDIVRTPKGQGVSVELSDESVVVLGEKAEAIINEKGIELKTGSAFVHVDKSRRSPKPFILSHSTGVLGAEPGDFEVRLNGGTVTVYSISSTVTVASSLEDLLSSRKHISIYETNFARLGASTSAPDTYQLKRLTAFEAEDNVFGMHIRHLRGTRFPLPTAQFNTSGSAPVSGTGLPPVSPGSSAPLSPGGYSRGW